MIDEQVYHVEHLTRYVHLDRVTTSQHVAYLEPRPCPRQQLVQHELIIEPAPESITRRVDYFGNVAHHFRVLTPYNELQVTSRAVAVVAKRTGTVDAALTTPWEQLREAMSGADTAVDAAIAEFTYPSPYVALSDDLAPFARASFPSGRAILEGAADLMGRIHRDFTFLPHVTSITTPVARVLAERHGVCQDFAHLQIACLRALGLPARYVSGYLLTDPPAGQPRLVGADASHAWLSVYCPPFGWVDLDPTNNVLPDERHITLAWGRDYGDVSPLRGVVLGGEEHRLYVGVSVLPMHLRNVAVGP
jgi:transglutaminase-like putative cysteine protease